MGSFQWPLLKLDIYGSLSANGQSFGPTRNSNASLIGGVGGGSGGTVCVIGRNCLQTSQQILEVYWLMKLDIIFSRYLIVTFNADLLVKILFLT